MKANARVGEYGVCIDDRRGTLADISIAGIYWLATFPRE